MIAIVTNSKLKLEFFKFKIFHYERDWSKIVKNYYIKILYYAIA